MVTTRINDGRHSAKVVSIDPNMLPVVTYPIYVAEFIPMGPGVICEMATTSVNSERESH